MKLLKQILVDTGSKKLCCRYDVTTHTLMFQNRSYDLEMSLDDFLDRLVKTQNEAEKKGYKIQIKEVTEKENWIN